MKKPLLRLLVILSFLFCISGMISQKSASASQLDVLSHILITKLPSKTTYSKGENLNLSDMVVKGFYLDGTSKDITDFEVLGYDKNLLGDQTINIKYDIHYASFQITVMPAKITNLKVSGYTTSAFTLTWKALPGISSYDIYVQSDYSGTYNYLTSSQSNSITFQHSSGTSRSYKIRAVEYVNGFVHYGELSDAIEAATSPGKVTGFKVQETASTSVTLAWDWVYGATGYLIYRSPSDSNNFKLIGKSDYLTYTDNSAKSSTSYQYKVCAYTLNDSFQGEYSSVIVTSTLPSKMSLKMKVGDEKVRISWNKITGATAYDLYISEDRKSYTLLTSINNADTLSYTVEGLTNQKTYYIYGVAKKVVNKVEYNGPASSIAVVKPQKKETSTKAKYFSNFAKFRNSWAYTNFPFFRNNVNFDKSIIIPGLITANVGGFSSTNMCPQGITFANHYILITAYDIAGEENSVIYVMDKDTNALLTTLVLPSKTHAGGIAFDETNVWVPTGTRLSSIPFTQIETAANSGKPYAYVQYNTTIKLSITASFLTYHEEKLWVGTYNELSSTTMYSYTIKNKDTKPELAVKDSMLMPNRTQGIAFTREGYLIISRSCQTNAGMRGYMHQIDVYKPDLSKGGTLSLGKLINTVEMPSMNEEIMVDENYLYVNYESAAFRKSTYKMDRITAIDLFAVLGIKKK